MKRKLIFLTLVSALLVGCGGVSKKNKWQKKEDFVERRSIYYNDFVQSGGMMKDENSDGINPMKKEIQNSLNQGRLVNSMQ